MILIFPSATSLTSEEIYIHHLLTGIVYLFLSVMQEHSLHEQMTNRQQFQKSINEIIQTRATRTFKKDRGRIRCRGGVSILCSLVDPPCAPYFYEQFTKKQIVRTKISRGAIKSSLP